MTDQHKTKVENVNELIIGLVQIQTSKFVFPQPLGLHEHFREDNFSVQTATTQT